MLSIAAMIALVMLAAAAAASLWRLARVPTAPDRILALDTLTINAIAIVLVAGMLTASAFYLEAALLMAMMGFVATVALAKFLLGGDIIE